MPSHLTGIHHVTAIAKDPHANVAFYTALLGQRLVKKTVNFDDPLTYHLYYGDERGSPGTLLTHFPNPYAKHGTHGSPEILESVLSVPTGSLGFWAARLRDAGVEADEVTVGGAPRLRFGDHDDMRFELVEDERAGAPAPWSATGIEASHAITGLDAAVIHVPEVAVTGAFLTDVLGFEAEETLEVSGDAPARQRFVLGDGAAGQRLELVERPFDRGTRMGAGTVHHVAWRVPDESVQAEVAGALRTAGLNVTPVMDRDYFRSIYVRIPGGVIFEIATDGPGFDADEPLATLGTELCLPTQHEPRRAEIEAHLVPLDPAGARP